VDDLRAELRRAATAYGKATRAQQVAQEALVAVVVATLRAGMPPGEVSALSTLSPSYVRKIARDHGIPPAPLGRKPSAREH
jgi:anti-sigma regulatory factor (Ser/Thr protein kinase)